MLTIREVTQYRCLVIKMSFKEQGWAIFRIDEEVGSLTVETDWGNYGYMWGHGGRGGRTLLEFLTTCGTHYMGQKLLSGKRLGRVVDGTRTRREMKQHARWLFKEGRMRIALDSHYTENEFELFRSLISEIQDLTRAIDGKDINQDFYGEAGELVRKVFAPLHESIRDEPPAWHKVLADEIVPAFQQYLKQMGGPDADRTTATS